MALGFLTFTQVKTFFIFQELLSAVARDIFHLESVCCIGRWRAVGDRLAALNFTLEGRLHHRKNVLAEANEKVVAILQPAPFLRSKFSIR